MKRMTTKLSLFTAAGAAALLMALAAVRTPAEDGASSGGDKPTYVGDKTCMKCHFVEHKSWKKTSMAKSMKTLAPTTEAEDKALFDKKKAASLDPAKDYTTDAKCLKCHTTGYGADGYPALAADATPTAEQTAAMTLNAGVTCEACHGPGSLYVKHKTAELEKNKDAKFTAEALAPMGLVKPDEKVCAGCHNAESPTKAEFKFAESKDKTHDKAKK
jgi:hypothetical protein